MWQSLAEWALSETVILLSTIKVTQFVALTYRSLLLLRATVCCSYVPQFVALTCHSLLLLRATICCSYVTRFVTLTCHSLLLLCATDCWSYVPQFVALTRHSLLLLCDTVCCSYVPQFVALMCHSLLLLCVTVCHSLLPLSARLTGSVSAAPTGCGTCTLSWWTRPCATWRVKRLRSVWATTLGSDRRYQSQPTSGALWRIAPLVSSPVRW